MQFAPICISRIHGHMSSVRVQHDVYAQVLVNHVYDADVLPRIKASNGNNGYHSIIFR